MSDTKLVNYLFIMVGINVILGLAQIGIASVDTGDAALNYYDTSGTVIGTLTPGGNLSAGLDNTKLSEGVEWETADSVEESGGIFTDGFKTAKRWINKVDSALGVLGSMLKQPYGFMKQIGIPIEICAAFGILWYLIIIILFFSFVRGGDAN